jgi:hypothetical protein
MTGLLRRSLAAAALVLLPAVAWAGAPDLEAQPGKPGLWLARDRHGDGRGYRGDCISAARDRGWHVRDVGEQRYMNGPHGGTWYVPMRIRDGRHSFEAMCEARSDGSDVRLRRRD